MQLDLIVEFIKMLRALELHLLPWKAGLQQSYEPPTALKQVQ